MADPLAENLAILQKERDQWDEVIEECLNALEGELSDSEKKKYLRKLAIAIGRVTFIDDSIFEVIGGMAEGNGNL